MFIVTEIDERLFGEDQMKKYLDHMDKLLKLPLLQSEREMLTASKEAVDIYLANPSRRRSSAGKV